MKPHTIACAVVFGCLSGAPAIAQQLPQFNIEAICRGVQPLTPEDRDPVQSCMRDEGEAARQLREMWSATAAARRQECVAETQVGGMPSYVDVLTCLQMGGASTSPPRRRRQG